MMKHRLIAVLLSALVCVCLLSACGGHKQDESTPPEDAVNLVYPDGEGNGIKQNGTQPAEETTQSEDAQKKTKPKWVPETTVAETEPPAKTKTTKPAVSATAPVDTVKTGNINPNISSIQSRISREISELAVKSISLSSASLTLEVGESAELKISFSPANPDTKLCTVSGSNKIIETELLGESVMVTGCRAGESKVTVTSQNGKKAVCAVTVKEPETVVEITDDTVLAHKELVTGSNAYRWCAAINDALENAGYVRDTALSGSDAEISTAEAEGDMSYNSAKELFNSLALQKLAQYEEDGARLEFNCVARLAKNSEYRFVISVSKIYNTAEESEIN